MGWRDNEKKTQTENFYCFLSRIASVWWPNKDHMYTVENMKISVNVPGEPMYPTVVYNVTKLKDGTL
jgi:hypothetical protein